MSYPVRIIPQTDAIHDEQQQRGRFMTRHERMLDAAVDSVSTGVLVIAHRGADGEYDAVTITKVRI